MYFCGYSTEQILEKKLPQKLLEQGINLTFILSIYAMLERKGDTSAMLVYGRMQDDTSPRGWIEYKDADGARMVRDYCSDWVDMPYTKFHNKYFPDTERLYLDYIFWEPYEKHLYELIQKPETSFVLAGISLICPRVKGGKFYGITNFNRHGADKITGTNRITGLEADFNHTVIRNPDDSFAVVSKDLIDHLMG